MSEKEVTAVESTKKESSKKDSKPEKKKKKGFKLFKFFKEVWVELKSRIVWPTPKQVVNNTIVVIVCCAVVGLFVFLLDTGLMALFNLILNL